MSKPIICAVCKERIVAYNTPGKGVSCGRVLIGGKLKPIHGDCYYGKVEAKV